MKTLPPTPMNSPTPKHTIISILEKRYSFDKSDPTSMLATIARLDEMLATAQREEDLEIDAETADDPLKNSINGVTSVEAGVDNSGTIPSYW